MTVQRVDPPALTSQAAEMKGQNWHNPAEGAVVAPDAVPSTAAAIANLNENAQSLKDFEEWAKIENQRIAEMLEIAAAAYQKVDEEYGDALDNPERAAAIDAINVPSPQTPPPEIPGPAGTPQLPDASGYSTVVKTQADLSAPDTGTSLKNAMLYWYAATNRVKNNKPKPPAGDWEGEAADAAYARMTTFGNWLNQLSDAWHDLGEAAAKLLEAHDTAKAAHEPIYQEYIELEKRMQTLTTVLNNMNNHPGAARAQRELAQAAARMEELQKQSDEVRQQYAGNATFVPVRPADPPFKPVGTSARGGGQGGGRGGGDDQPPGDPAAIAQKMGESMGTSQPQSGTGQGGGSGGGSPSGGESPSGGAGSGGSPGGSEGGGSAASTPKSPTDPSLRPAASGGSGGGSGGGAGGGAGSVPLSPAVSAETVAPAPPMPVSAGSAPAAAAAPGGMAGGMGGMAPMHGAQGAQQGKEKRRDPRTAPDEDLYVEDRPWTEGVVGNRRRREVHEGRAVERDDDEQDDE